MGPLRQKFPAFLLMLTTIILKLRHPGKTPNSSPTLQEVSPRYTLVPRSGRPRYTLVPRSGSPQPTGSSALSLVSSFGKLWPSCIWAFYSPYHCFVMRACGPCYILVRRGYTFLTALHITVKTSLRRCASSSCNIGNRFQICQQKQTTQTTNISNFNHEPEKAPRRRENWKPANP